VGLLFVGNKLMEKEVSINKSYNLPKETQLIIHDSNYVVVYTEGCNWLLFNKETYKIYQFFEKKHTIKEAYTLFDNNLVNNVIREIEAKNFENCINTEQHEEKSVFIYLTNNCNLRCPYCYMYSGELIIQELELEQWKAILLELSKNGYKNITFSGGEPLLYKSFKELCIFANTLGFNICVLSNGILWDDKLISELSGSISEVQLSLDGYDCASYKFVRDYDGFDKVLDTLDKLDKLGIFTSLSVTPLYEKLDNFINHYKDFALFLNERYPNTQIKFSYELMPGRTIKISKEENQIYRSSITNLVREIDSDYFDDNFYINLKTKQRITSCGYGGLTISSEGKVYLCNRIFSDKSVGEITKGNIQELENIAKNSMDDKSLSNVYPCAKCPLKYICGGGCRLEFKENKNPKIKYKYIRACSNENRKIFLDRMISANEYFYE
jgi:radical SAM protein with 4Fe4S-binding SPASM domain